MKPDMNKTKSQGTAVDLINGPIMKNLLIFMLPILISYVFQQLYNAVDTAIVGHFLGEQSLAAVGANVAIFDLMVMFAQSLGNGLCIVVSRAYGAGDDSKLRKSVAGSLVIGAGTVAVMMVAQVCGRLACDRSGHGCGDDGIVAVWAGTAPADPGNAGSDFWRSAGVHSDHWRRDRGYVCL